MQLIQHSFFDEHGKLDDKLSEILDNGIRDLVTKLLVALPHPEKQPLISQIYLRHMATSRLDMSLAIAFISESLKAGQGMFDGATKNPLDILESDIDIAFEKADNGRWDGEHAHDMLQTFSRMLAGAKKGQSYFSDDYDFPDADVFDDKGQRAGG